MTTYRVDELEAGPLLDRAVAQALGIPLDTDGDRLDVRDNGGAPLVWRPSTVWNDGGPIIESEEIGVVRVWGGWYAQALRANVPDGEPGSCYLIECEEFGGNNSPTPLVAAMRALLKFRLGADVVELP